MRIHKITFVNNTTGWNIRNMRLDCLTLLVGVSGIGKTQILRSILELSKIATGYSARNVEWSVEFEHESNVYQWSGCYENTNADDMDAIDERAKRSSIVFENLSNGDKEIIRRTKEEILFDGNKTVKLDSSKSAVELLKEEELIAPVHDAFMHVFIMDNANNGIRISPYMNDDYTMITDIDSIRSNHYLSPLEKLFLLFKNGLPEYLAIKSSFIQIFPIIEDIDFQTTKLFDNRTIPVIRIKERGVESWISQNMISSGMFRTLMQITTFELAQDGDLFLIDEFENGLGVNCIDKLADDIIDMDKEVQVIITSHHPYIINTIPFERWKVVVRERGNVEVLSATDLNIGKHSRHDAFMQLIQTKAFKLGQK